MSKNIVQKFSATSHPTTYALLIGIDEYPIPGHRLRGCRNDVEALEECLEALQGEGEWQLRKLLDHKASREKVIAACLELKVAKKGDVCLIYFSGHGSSEESPAVFRHMDINGRMQSIVCHDSRLPGGRDLTDKELSHLTWEITYDQDNRALKEVHLVTIFDCCHAGGNTKEAERDRGIDEGVIPTEIQAYHGHQHFDRQVVRGKVYFTPKRGPHIQLAASGENEKAKERDIDGLARGIYTYSLIQLLKSHKGAITYAQLQQALFVILQNKSSRQTPQLDAVATRIQNRPFLNLADKTASNAFVLSYHQELQEWLLPTGQMQGMVPTQLDQFKFYVPATDSSHGVKEAYLSHAALADFHSTKQDQVFLANLLDLGKLKQSIGITPNLKDKLAAHLSPYFYLTETDQANDYQLKEQEQEQEVCLLQNNRTIYRQSLPQSSQAAIALTEKLEAIARWHRVLAIQNENPHLKPSHYQIKWYRQEGADAYPSEDQAPIELLPTDQKKAIFSYRWDTHYRKQEKTWLEPAFKLNFTNKSGRALYVTALYLQADFKITDRFCAPTLLDSGQPLDFQYRTKSGRLYRSIFLSIYPELQQAGNTSIKEYIKLFISYKPFDLQQLKQDGLYTQLVHAPHSQDPSKAIGSQTTPILGGHRDWTVETLELTIEKL